MVFHNLRISILGKFFLILFTISSILPFSNIRSENNLSNDNELTKIDDQSIYKNDYILGSGDILFIKFEDFPEYSAMVKIQNDGNLYLPKIGNIHADNLIIDELNELVLRKYSEIMINPIIDIYIAKQRPIKIFLAGEIARPGLYKLTNDLDAKNYFDPAPLSQYQSIENFSIDNTPTLYEGIKRAQGITNETDLENIEFRRKIPDKYGGGYKKTNLNLLSIFIDGNDKNNINLMDGDVIIFKKSKNKIASQIIKASKNNLNPSSIAVYITGRVQMPGLKSLKYGSTLSEAIAVAGGPKVLRGKIQLITSKNDQLLIKNYKYNPGKINTKNNPILQTGDIVRIRNSVASATTELFSEILPPIIGIGTVNNLLNQ